MPQESKKQDGIPNHTWSSMALWLLTRNMGEVSSEVFCKKIVFLLLLFVVVFPTTIHARQLKKGMKLSAARSLLIDQGWLAVNVHDGEKYEYVGIESLLINANIKEVESCAIDKAVCIFNYKKGNKCLRLFTHGEEVNDMRVISWTCDCPDGDE